MPSPRRGLRVLALLILALAQTAQAGLDLSAAAVHRLENGLVLVVLEEPAFPVASVQMVYRVGAKHEPAGGSGLAHFFEHMAFRSSENFPDTGLVSEIYAVGGEWHGYTWLDQTTYFATAPKDDLDLLLRIEADRMGRLTIPEDRMEAERGAVLAEMHGYENDPATVLQDYVMYLSFVAHPYRANTIGWESDIAGLSHAEVVDFYRRHYQPGNAVLAVVGDVDAAEVTRRVTELFGEFPGAARTPPPRTHEPPQSGERRVRLQGATERKHFRIAWHAPSVRSPDFAAFLVLQELLSAGSGASFLQNDWGTPARPDSPLGRVTPDIATWYPPSEEDYVFTVSGSIDAAGEEQALERAVSAAIAQVAQLPDDAAAAQALAQARDAVRRALRFDIQTTEDAAHQLASFAAMDALAVLTGLPAAVEAVTLDDVRRLAATRLRPEQRTVGWMVPAAAAAPASRAPTGTAEETVRVVDLETDDARTAAAEPPPAARHGVVPAPLAWRVDGDPAIIVQPSPLSPTVHVQAVLPGQFEVPGYATVFDEPGRGLGSIHLELEPAELDRALAELAAALPGAVPAPDGCDSAGADPLARLACLFDPLAPARAPTGTSAWPRLLIVSGDVAGDAALAAVQRHFPPRPAPTRTPPAWTPEVGAARMEIESRLETPVPQEALGYFVPAPGPGDPAAAAWAMALYLFSHGYEGRLGKEAISRRGLAYYIDAAYRSDGRHGWIELSTGVDPEKLPAMRELLRSELQRMITEPPGPAELQEARRHLLGRQASAAQSNRELTGRYAREWLWYGGPLTVPELEERLQRVSLEELHGILPAFTAGTVVAVRGPEAAGGH